jgi:voltage-gated sodium channel type IV alpha
MKMIGLGPRAFVREKFNIFDMLIVIVSLIEILISSGKGRGSFGALRAFRLLRIFKIFRVESLRILIDSIAFTLTTIGNYFILLILFIYVYALLGMTFFAG